MARTFIPHESGRFRGVPVPKNRIDGENLGLAVVVEDADAFDRNTMAEIRREARAAGVPVLGKVPDQDRLIVVLKMPEDPAKLFIGLGNPVMDVKVERHMIDLRDDGEIVARFQRAARDWEGAGEAHFAPLPMGRNLMGGEVTQRLLGRTFSGDGVTHAEWETHRDGHAKGHGPRKTLFLRAETLDDYGLLARTLVARLDRNHDPIIREREITALLDGAKTPDGIDMNMADFRELIEQEVTAVSQIGGIANRDAATRLSMGFPAYTARSGTKLVRAQFSTPPAVGLAAAQFLKPEGRAILEPTVGNGVLVAASAAQGGMVMGVEIDRARAARASKALGQTARVAVGDALQAESYPANPVTADGKFDAVLANPPYMRLSESSTEDKKITTSVNLPSLGFQFEAKTAETLIAAQSIERLKDGGNAVFVMPAEMMKPTEINGHRRQFQALLNSSFRDVKSVVLDADLYSSMGSRFPVIVHFCEDKRTRDTVPALSELKDLAPDHYRFVDSYAEFYSFVDNVLEASAIKTLDADQIEANRAAWAGQPAPEIEAEAAQGVETDGPDVPAQEDQSGPSQPSGGTGTGPSRSGPRAPADPVADVSSEDDAAPGDLGADGPDDPPADQPGADDLTVAPEHYHFSYRDDFGDDPMTAPYRATSAKKGVESVIERTLEAGTYAAMHRLVGEVGNIDAYVAEALGMSEDDLIGPSGPLSPEQIDSFALSLHNRRQKSATIIGDLMGVGKGRQLAAHMVAALNEGRPIIAMTNKKHLFRDLVVRDLGAVSGQSVAGMIEDKRLRPFIFNNDPEARLTEKDGKTVIFGTPVSDLTAARSAGAVPAEHNLILSTYSQFRSGGVTWRQDAIKQWIDHHVAEGRAPVILLDEVHEAAGEASVTGKVMRDLLDYAHDRGSEIVYSSATSMKSGRNIAIYKYALPETGMSMDQLFDLIEANELEMQEILSAEMAREGRMLQRKMPSAGVERDTVRLADIDPDRMDEAREMWAKFANFLREMVDAAPAIKKAAKEQFASSLSGVSNSQSGAGGLDVTTTSPASMFDNVSRYFLLSIKGRFMREMMEDSLARGEKLAVLQDLTGDTLGEYVRSGRIVDDERDEEENEEQSQKPKGANQIDPYGEDVDFEGQIVDAHPHIGHVLMRMASRMIEAKGTDALGGSAKLVVERFAGWAEDLQERIRDSGFEKWRVNTFDLAKEISDELGLGFEDITKRRLAFKTDPDGNVRVSVRATPSKMATAYDFNRGEIDVIGLNNAAATGMSIQASPAEGPDLRRRTMLFMSFLKNIADHQQAEGRIDRKGQVEQPRYIIPNSGFVADDRLASLFNRGNRNLSSMTAATRESNRTIDDVVDLLNPIGDQAVAITLRRNPMLGEMLGIAIDDSTPTYNMGRKFLGRAFILGPDMSAAAINEVDMCYVALLDKLTREGKNPLRLKHYDWKADVKVVDVLEDGDESARGMAQQPLKLTEFSWTEPRSFEKPERIMSEIGEYIHARKEPFVRLDHFLNLSAAMDYSHANWQHPLFDEVTGREAFQSAGRIFPVPMSDGAMSELMMELSQTRHRTVMMRESREWSADDEAKMLKKVGERLTEMTERALAYKINPADNPEVGYDDRRAFGEVLDHINTAMNGQKPAFAQMKWTRALRMVRDRVEAVEDVGKFASVIEPGRLVALNARALAGRDGGLLAEMMSEAGLFETDRPLWLPAVVTSARYKADSPLTPGSYHVSLSVPGSEWRVSRSVHSLQSALDLGGFEKQKAIAPIGEFNRMIREDMRFGGVIREWELEDKVRAAGENGVGVLSKAMFGARLGDVVRAIMDYENARSTIQKSVDTTVVKNEDETVPEWRARWQNALDVRMERIVESPSLRNPAPERLFDAISQAVPDGLVEKRRFGLTGNLFAAASATMSRGRGKSLGEKASVTTSDGANINTYLVPFGDASSIIRNVRERSASKSAVRPELTGDVVKVEAMLTVLSTAMRAAREGIYRYADSGHIEMSSIAEVDSFKQAVSVLFPEAVSTPERDRAWDANDSAILNNMASRLTAAAKTYPASLMTGGDVWAQAVVEQENDGGRGGRRNSSGAAMPVAVRVKYDGGKVLGAEMSTSGAVLNDAVRLMDRNQLLVMVDDQMGATVLLRKTHDAVKTMRDDSVTGLVVGDASTNSAFDGATLRLTKGLMAARYDLRFHNDRERVALFMVEASREVTGLNAEIMLGGYGKVVMGALQGAIREHVKSVDLALMKDHLSGPVATPEASAEAQAPAVSNDPVERRDRGGMSPAP